MVVAEKMVKPTVKISVSSDSDSSSDNDGSENEMDENNSEADVESEASSHENDEDANQLLTNEGWADSVAKILSSTKPKNKKTLVLSRAKKFSEAVKPEKEEKPTFEVIGEVNENKSSIKREAEDLLQQHAAKKKKNEKPSIRLKPNILEKDRERLLTKIATKGVVQLFNAVRNQQKSLDNELERKDLSEGKKEKILKKFDKRAFLDTLMGPTKSVIVDEETKKYKKEIKEDESAPKWSALRDDFMMGAKMKDWDKESVDE